MATYINNNVKFHAFSKSPVSPDTTLGGAVNPSGHTITTSQVRSQDIPAFLNTFQGTKEQALTWVASNYATPAHNDIVYYGGEFKAGFSTPKCLKYNAKAETPAWEDFDITAAATLKNADDKDVIAVHQNCATVFVDGSNNAATNSNRWSLFVKKSDGTILDHFVASTDKIVAGQPSLGYNALVMWKGAAIDEGELDNNYVGNTFAGIVHLNKQYATGDDANFTVTCFEYIGEKLDTTVADLAAAVFGSGSTPDGDQPVSLQQQVNANTAAIATLNGAATEAGSVAKAVADAEGRVKVTTDALAGRISQLEGVKLSVQVVDALPEVPVINTIYLVPDEDKTTGNYIEYIAYKPEGSETVTTERIGTTAVDLEGYTTDAEHTALADRVTALDSETGRVAVVEGKVKTLEETTIPAIQKSVTDGVSEAKTYAEEKASAAQTAATNAASQALATARGEITQEIATAQSAAESTAAGALSAAVEQIGKDIEAAKSEAISKAEVTITAGTGIVVTPEGKGTTFEISVSDAVATAADLAALTTRVTTLETTTVPGIDSRLQAAEATITSLTSGDASVDAKISAAVESLEGEISQAQTTLQGNIDGVAQELSLVKADIATGATAQAIAKAQGDATQALTDAAAVSTALDTAKTQTLEQTGTWTGMFSVATAGSVGTGITSITITDSGLTQAIADAKSGAEQTAATALATARGEITTEISTAVSGLETKLTTGEGSLGAKVAALETATTTTLPDAIEQALEDAKAYSDSLHTTSLDYVVLGDSESLPTASVDTLGKIYLVASQNAPAADGSAISGSYVEYMTRKVSETEYTWEKIGTTAADLSAYAKTADVTTSIATAKSEAIAAAKTETTTQVNALAATHATDKAALEGSISTINTKIDEMDADLSVNGISVKQVDGKVTELTEALITASVPAGTTSVEGNVAYVGSTKHVIAPEKFQTAAQMPATLTSWVADLSNLTDGTAMFKGCTGLTTFVGDLSSLTNGTEMFSGCTLDAESLEILSENLSTVTSGTIEIGASTNATDEVIATIKGKGWTVTSNGIAL